MAFNNLKFKKIFIFSIPATNKTVLTRQTPSQNLRSENSQSGYVFKSEWLKIYENMSDGKTLYLFENVSKNFESLKFS